MTLLTGSEADASSENGQSFAETNMDGDSAAQAATPPPASTWRDSLSDEFKGHTALESFQDLNGLAKSYINASSMIGKDKFTVPDKHATAEDWKAVYSKLGLPAKEEYTFEGMDAESDKEFAAFAHENNLLPQQAKVVRDLINNQMETASNDEIAEYQRLNDEGVNALKKEWGDGFNTKVDQARAAIETYGSEDIKTYLNETGIGNDPMLVRMFADIGATLGEDTIKGMGGNVGGVTPEAAQGEINRIMGDHAHPYYDKTHPSHMAAVTEVNELYNKVLTQNV